MFENLLLHMVNLEHDKNKLVDEYFPGQTKERNRFRDLLDNYIAKIDILITNNLCIGENSDNSLPFVVIGSDIEVIDMKTNDVFNYRMVTPYNNKEAHDVSIFSPVGKSMLLKKVGDEVTINTPGGKLKYKIQSIKMPLSQPS
ncbi:GreA/GreB family elongation factor [Pelotomaculum propionicicum]|uniref:GreA/GreB family elongation factor n=1 Tax=Pelotomaculum propionicicum TaxID=258475 RepID=UPI003BA15BD2